MGRAVFACSDTAPSRSGLHPHPTQRSAIFEGCSPDNHIRMIYESIQANLGDLDPNLHGLPIDVLRIFKQALGRSDADDKVAEFAIHQRAEVDACLDKGIG